MSKKLFPVISILLVAAFMLAACAPAATTVAPAPTQAPANTQPPAATQAPGETKAAPTATKVVPPTPTLAPQQIRIKIWHQWDGAYLVAIQAAFADYMKAHPNILIDLSKPDDPSNALAVAIPAGEGPDIMGWANDAIGTQALKGTIVPLDTYGITQDFLKSTYVPSAVAGVSYQGKIWALPESVEAIALVYNKKLVTAEYLPKDGNDWAGLLAASEKFKTANPGKTLICNQGIPGGDAYHIAPIFFGFGVPSYVDETGKVYLNTPEGVKAMEWLVNLKKSSTAEQTYDVCGAGLKEGKYGMWWTGPWAIKSIEDNKVDYGILPMGKPFVGIKTLMMTKNAVDRKNTEVVIDIMKYFTSADVQTKIALVNKTIPAPIKALQNPDIAKLTAVVGFGAAASVGIPMSPSPYSGAQWGPVGDAVKAIWAGGQKPADALKGAQKLVEDAIAQMK
jgi:arabinogalactan oligomer / maltooligosaccharide transport system substrate-binding protein